MWAAQFIGYENPKTWINSGGLGTMGFSDPAAMGAKVGMPDTTVWSIDGDGCFQMTHQELAPCAINDIQLGRESCRQGECQYVYNSVVECTVKKQKKINTNPQKT